MAAADKTDRSYIESLKELRSIRIQQIKQMNAEQRYHSLQSEYNKRLLRYNELFVSNMKDMTSKLGNAIANLSSKLASGVGSAASGVASGVSSLSGSILSGLGKALPIGIAALLAKVLLWDNMSSITQDRLSGAFGKLMEKLLAPVKAMIGNITSGFKSLDIKFPLFDELFDRFTKFFEILQSGFKIISLKFDSMMETFGKDPKKYVKDTLNLLGDAAMLGILSTVAGKVVLQMFRNHMLLNSIDSLLVRRMGGQIPGSGGGMVPPVIAPGGRATPAAPGGTSTPRILDQFGRPLPPSTLNATKQATTSILSTMGRMGGRLVGALASGPVLTLLAAGVLAYDAYQILKGWGVSDKDAEEAVNMVYPEGFQEVNQLSGKISGTIPLKPLSQDVIADFKRKDNPVTDEYGITRAGPLKLDAQVAREQKILKEYEDNARAVQEQIRLEEGKDIAPFALRDFYAEWGRMKPNARRIAVEIMQPIIRTLNYVYYMGRDGKPKKMKQDDYLDAILGNNGVEEVSAEDLQRNRDGAITALANLTREGEAGKAGYNAIFEDDRLKGMQLPGGKQVSELTMREVMQVQTEMLSRTKTGGDPHSPIGGYQFIKSTLFGGRVKNKETGKYEDVKGIVKESEMDKIFNSEFQDELFKRMANKNLEAFLSGQITKDQFKTYMMNTWEIFQGKNANAQVFAKKLDAMLDSPEIMQASGSTQDSGTRTKAQREAEIKMYEKNIDRLMKDVTKPLSNTTPMTIRGESVVGMAKDAVENAGTKLSDFFSGVRKSVNPEDLTNDLINTLNTINTVRNATEKPKSGEQASVNNIITNNYNSNSVASGGSRSVNPVYSLDRTAHRTLSGFA